jgi:hypothetical protein
VASIVLSKGLVPTALTTVDLEKVPPEPRGAVSTLVVETHCDRAVARRSSLRSRSSSFPNGRPCRLQLRTP